MKSKIYITGASGFIGFHTAKKFLELGITVHGFDSMNKYYDIKLKKSRLNILKKYKNFSFTRGLLENQKLLNNSILNFKPQIIIHLAAQAGVRFSIENPESYINSNIVGTFNVIKIANKIKVKHLIIGSSSSVYGANKKFPFQEIDKTDHQVSFYAATKKSTENLAHSYSALWKLPVTMLRFFTVYGPWGRPDMAYFKFTKNILAGKKN
jgi:UDP-glucuronate 4-epimerase